MKGCKDLRVVVCSRAWSKAVHSLFGLTNESSSTYVLKNNDNRKSAMANLIQDADQIQTNKILYLENKFCRAAVVV